MRSLCFVIPLVAVACGGAPEPPAASPASSTQAPTEPVTEGAADTGTPPAEEKSETSAPAKAATAEEAAAACSTTATYDKKEPNKLTFKVTNKSEREVKVCWLEFYLYDKGGNQLGHVTLPYNFKIAPGESDGQPYEFSDLGKQIGGKAVATIETVVSSAKFTDGAEFEDKSLAPDQRPRASKK